MYHPAHPLLVRVAATPVLFLSAWLLPWPVFFCIAVVGVLLFPFFFEAVGAAFLIDALFGVPLPHFFASGAVLTAAIAAIACIAELVKGNMRSYRSAPW